MSVSDRDREDLRRAKTLLENPGLAVKLTNLIGAPIEKGFELLPAAWSEGVTAATRKALDRALRLAVATLDDRRPTPSSSNTLHKIMVGATGAGAGAFGLAALPIELPIATTVMLRSIADVARSEGEHIKAIQTQLACLEVFALGGRSKGDDAAETGYFAVRAALARAVSEAAQFITERGLVQEGAPVIARLIGQIAARFGIVVSEKAAAQAVPILGAVGGVSINLLFIDHFQDMARGHFVIRRLERAHGPEKVRLEYDRL